MKKNYFILMLCLLWSIYIKAQDTLLFQDFQKDEYIYMKFQLNPPPGIVADPYWYNYDADQKNPRHFDQGQSSYWWRDTAFSDADYNLPFSVDVNYVMLATSWFSPRGTADNWLITPNVTLGAHDTLFWKSAPFQTPRYLDGYKVLISTTNNDDLSFTTILESVAEMRDTSYNNKYDFNEYTFSPGYVHGRDGTYIEFFNDSSTWTGVLRPFSVPLDAYANKNVFIAFHHDSNDDNIIALDDVLIRGTAGTTVRRHAGIDENTNELEVSLYPNPATTIVNLSYTLPDATPVALSIYDVTGKLVFTESETQKTKGRHFSKIDTGRLENGFYSVSLLTNFGQYNSKLIIR